MKMLWALVLLPLGAWAQTDMPTSTTVPAAPSQGQQELLNACLDDMPHRVGVWQSHGDLVCSCMFTGPNAWKPDGEPDFTERKYRLLARLIKRGGLTNDLRDAAQADGIKNPDVEKLGLFARVYPAVLFQNKAVVACFNDKCRETSGCEVQMNDVSGTAPSR